MPVSCFYEESRACRGELSTEENEFMETIEQIPAEEFEAHRRALAHRAAQNETLWPKAAEQREQEREARVEAYRRGFYPVSLATVARQAIADGWPVKIPPRENVSSYVGKVFAGLVVPEFVQTVCLAWRAAESDNFPAGVNEQLLTMRVVLSVAEMNRDLQHGEREALKVCEGERPTFCGPLRDLAERFLKSYCGYER
jgi:hypothetical protein